MALQSSGPISMSDIKAELNSEDFNLSVLSELAGFSAPHAMSEFYGYSYVPPPPPSSFNWTVSISHSVGNIRANMWGGVVNYDINSTVTRVFNSDTGANIGYAYVDSFGLYVRYNYIHRGTGWYGPGPDQTATVDKNSNGIFGLNSTLATDARVRFAGGAELVSANTELLYVPENYNITFIDNY